MSRPSGTCCGSPGRGRSRDRPRGRRHRPGRPSCGPGHSSPRYPVPAGCDPPPWRHQLRGGLRDRRPRGPLPVRRGRRRDHPGFVAGFDAGVWHGFLPGIGVGQAYGYRVPAPTTRHGGCAATPRTAPRPLREGAARDRHPGPEILGYASPDNDAPSGADSAARVPRSLVATRPSTGPMSTPGVPLRGHHHLRGPRQGLTMRHPEVPPPLRGTYAGLAHRRGHRLPARPGRDHGRAAARARERARVLPGRPGPDQLLGLQHDRPLRPASGVLGRDPGRTPGADRRVQGDGGRAAPGRPRGRPRRGVRPTRRRPARPDALLPRPGQPRLLPAGRGDPRSATTPPAPGTR